MNSEQIEAGLLINEWQLGSQLNVAVANGTRDKFNLLLSLLSDDARDFSQFATSKATPDSLATMALRDAFHLAPAQPLVNQGISLQQSEKLSISLHKKDLTDIRLQTLLNNEAILSRAHCDDFDRDIVDNLSFLSQTRLKNASQTKDSEGSSTGIDHDLMESYQALNLNDKPVKLNYG